MATRKTKNSTNDLPLKYNLTENEVLKFKNIALQKQYLQSEIEKLTLQEELLAQTVSNRVGQNVSKWIFNFQESQVFHPNYQPEK